MKVETRQQQNTFSITSIGSCELLTGPLEGRCLVECTSVGATAVSVAVVVGTAEVAAPE